MTPFNAPAALVGASVKLSIAVQSTQGEVLAVPVNALSVGADGRERVQVDRGGGRTRSCSCAPGLRAQGFVEVSPRSAGELKEGDRVVIGSRRRRGGEGADRVRRAGDARRARARRRARGAAAAARRRRGAGNGAAAPRPGDDRPRRPPTAAGRRRAEPDAATHRRRAGDLPWTVTAPRAGAPASAAAVSARAGAADALADAARARLAVLPRPPVVELRNVSRTYGADPPVQALRGVDLVVERGDAIAIVGPSGRASRRC